MNEFMTNLIDILTKVGSRLLLALLIYVIGSFVVKHLLKVADRICDKRKLDPTVKSFLTSAAKILLYVILIVAIIHVLGVDTASIIAVIASCGVAVGLALQGALANIAGGIMLLVFRPFSVGDYVITGSGEGSVRDISLFYTTLNTLDNKVITVPNGALMNAAVTNLSKEPQRRVDLAFSLTGAVDIEKVQQVILGVAAANEKVLQDPAPFAAPLQWIAGGLEYTVRVWAAGADYWDVYFALMKDIPTALAQAGITGAAPISKVVVDK